MMEGLDTSVRIGRIKEKNLFPIGSIYGLNSNMKKCTYCDHLFDADDWRCPECRKSPELNQGILSFLNNYSQIKASFDADYFPMLYGMEHGNFWFQHRNNLIIWAIKTYFPHVKKFLECGCGTGHVLSGIRTSFPKASLSGGELFVEGLLFAKTRVPDASLYQIDVCNIPFKDEFDLVGTFDILEHVEDDEEALSEIFQALQWGGGLIITVPQHQWMWTKQDDIAYHKRRYSRAELVNKMEYAGFKIKYVTSFVSLLFPLLCISRMYSFIASRPREELRELAENPIMNKMLSFVCMLEEKLVERNARFPFGGSLLCIGIKE